MTPGRSSHRAISTPSDPAGSRRISLDDVAQGVPDSVRRQQMTRSRGRPGADGGPGSDTGQAGRRGLRQRHCAWKNPIRTPSPPSASKSVGPRPVPGAYMVRLDRGTERARAVERASSVVEAGSASRTTSTSSRSVDSLKDVLRREARARPGDPSQLSAIAFAGRPGRMTRTGPVQSSRRARSRRPRAPSMRCVSRRPAPPRARDRAAAWAQVRSVPAHSSTSRQCAPSRCSCSCCWCASSSISTLLARRFCRIAPARTGRRRITVDGAEGPVRAPGERRGARGKVVVRMGCSTRVYDAWDAARIPARAGEFGRWSQRRESAGQSQR